MLTLPYFDVTRFMPLFVTQLPHFFKKQQQQIVTLKHPVLKRNIAKNIVKKQIVRNVFVKSLIHNNQLRVRLPSGDFMTVYADAYDRINSQLIIPDQAEHGLLYLEKGDKVEFYSNLTQSHEYFSFISKVVKIKVKGIKLTYYMSVPRILKKSHRRVIPRTVVKNHSIIRIDGSSFSGRVVDLSANGISFAIDGYYPEVLEIGDVIKKCSIDIFQPRINDNLSFNCTINIKRFDYKSKPERMTLIAGTYTNEDLEQEKKIFSYLVV